MPVSSQTHWIPAFAGMTTQKMSDQIKGWPERSSVVYSNASGLARRLLVVIQEALSGSRSP
jgi:hypothetical protein